MEFRNLIDQNLNENFFAILAIKIRLFLFETALQLCSDLIGISLRESRNHSNIFYCCVGNFNTSLKVPNEPAEQVYCKVNVITPFSTTPDPATYTEP